MALLFLGLLIFLGGHSLRICAGGWRDRQIARLGEKRWKGLYTLAAFVGFGLIVIGFGQAGPQEALWSPPGFMPHVTALLTLFAFLLIVAAYVPGNRLKSAIGHPMVLGVKLWAFAHLLSNAQPRHLALFGAFLVWAIVDFASLRRRDRAAGTVYPAGGLRGDVTVVAVGLVVWALFAFKLHGLLIGVYPFA